MSAIVTICNDSNAIYGDGVDGDNRYSDVGESFVSEGSGGRFSPPFPLPPPREESAASARGAAAGGGPAGSPSAPTRFCFFFFKYPSRSAQANRRVLDRSAVLYLKDESHE